MPTEVLSNAPGQVLIICPEPQAYTSRLAGAFPQVTFTCVASLECTPALDRMGEADAILVLWPRLRRAMPGPRQEAAVVPVPDHRDRSSGAGAGGQPHHPHQCARHPRSPDGRDGRPAHAGALPIRPAAGAQPGRPCLGAHPSARARPSHHRDPRRRRHRGAYRESLQGARHADARGSRERRARSRASMRSIRASGCWRPPRRPISCSRCFPIPRTTTRSSMRRSSTP